MLQKEHRKILPTIHPPNPPKIISSQTRFRYIYNPQIEMFAHFKTKSSFHKTKGII